MTFDPNMTLVSLRVLRVSSPKTGTLGTDGRTPVGQDSEEFLRCDVVSGAGTLVAGRFLKDWTFVFQILVKTIDNLIWRLKTLVQRLSQVERLYPYIKLSNLVYELLD